MTKLLEAAGSMAATRLLCVGALFWIGFTTTPGIERSLDMIMFLLALIYLELCESHVRTRPEPGR